MDIKNNKLKNQLKKKKKSKGFEDIQSFKVILWLELICSFQNPSEFSPQCLQEVNFQTMSALLSRCGEKNGETTPEGDISEIFTSFL